MDRSSSEARGVRSRVHRSSGRLTPITVSLPSVHRQQKRFAASVAALIASPPAAPLQAGRGGAVASSSWR